MTAPLCTPKLQAERFSCAYGETTALRDITLAVAPRAVTALIGPSGCGKTTLLRAMNRMNEVVTGTRVDGRLLLDGTDIYGPDVDVVTLRRRVGMVFQTSTPFPTSVFDNVAYGLRVHGLRNRADVADRVESSLQAAGLWAEVRDGLHQPAMRLSGGQQQRLCIARALAVTPEVLLLDEPASALDPIATQRIEDLIHELKKTYTIVLVTHNLQQAARVSDVTAFLWMGALVEEGPTARIFTAPRESLTEDYLTGRCG